MPSLSNRLRGRLRRIAKLVLPPVALTMAGRVAPRAWGEWEYLPGGWPAEQPGGWNDASVVDTQHSAWANLVEFVKEPSALGLAKATLEPSTEADYAAHNTAMAFAYVLTLASRGRDRLSFLDWGGGLGQYAVIARALLPTLEIEYHCRDLPLLAERGRQLLPNDSFLDSDEGALARRYDLVMASASLHYVRNWREQLGRLAAATDGYLYITRLPIALRAASFVVLQRPHRHGYKTKYAGWFLNRAEFLDAASGMGLRLRREFLIAERPFVPRAPERAEYRGFLFEPVARPNG